MKQKHMDQRIFRFLTFFLGMIVAAAGVLFGFVFSTVSAATTIGSNIVTGGDATVSGILTANGNFTANSGINMNFTSGEGIVLDYGSSPNAAALRTTWGGASFPFAEFKNFTTTGQGASGFHNIFTLTSGGSVNSAQAQSLNIVNNGDAGDRIYGLLVDYDSSSTAASLESSSRLLGISMNKTTNNYAFPYGVRVTAGDGGGDDAGVDSLLTTAYDASDPDIDVALDIGSNVIKSDSTGVVTFKPNGPNLTTTLTAVDDDANANLKLDPGGTGLLLLDMTQADLGTTCTAGQVSLDTGGATRELCFCSASNTWECISMTKASSTTGPTD